MEVITDKLHNELVEAQEKQAGLEQDVAGLLGDIKGKVQYEEYDHDLDLVDRLIHIRCSTLEKVLCMQAEADGNVCRILAELTQQASEA